MPRSALWGFESLVVVRGVLVVGAVGVLSRGPHSTPAFITQQG